MEKHMVRVLKMSVVVFTVCFGSGIAVAEKLDDATNSLVIDKLERALDLMEKGAPERQGVILRLGDLYSERARLRALEEGKQGCDNCAHSKEDREEALSYYKQAFPKTKGEQQGKLLVQMAHLNNMNGKGNKAQDIYNDVIKKGRKSYTSAVVASANANTGDIHFRKGNFKTAKRYYEAALKEDLQTTRGYVQYRLAWCELNLGNFEKATQSLVKILSTPNMSDDPTFREDVSKDLAAFLAHGEVGNKEIAMLKNLSPEHTRRSNLFLLGTETDRLGNKSASLAVWAAYANEGETKGIEKLEIQIRIAQSEYDLGRRQQALGNFDKAIETWTQTKFEEKDEDKRSELKTRMRNFVTNWNKALKVKPTVELLRAYQIYLKGFSDDAEMTQWAALVAREVKQYRDAVALFRKSALLAKNDKSPAGRKILEGSLLGEMEMAEKSGDLGLREASYTFYIENNPEGEKAFESRFQRANVWYQQGKHTQAYSEFHYIATAPGDSHRNIKVKAADLSLDTLVLLKDDKSLQVRANEYAKIYPERQKEYAEIARKATLNQVASNMNSKDVDSSDIRASLAQLKTVSLAGASDEDKVKYWKNRINVAMQAKDLNEVDQAANGLLAVKKLSVKDREFGFAQKEWVAELQLNFKDAYRYARQISYSNLSAADRDLRYAFLADLSGRDSRQHYEDFLRHEKNFHQRNLTRVTLVQRSSRPWKELNRHLNDLKRSPDLLAPLVLETFGRDRNVNEARKILAKTSIGLTPQGHVLAHQVDFNEFARFHSRIASHHLRNTSDAALASSLKQRLDLLSEAGRRLQQFNRRHDTTMQVVALNLLAKENKRLGDDLLRLHAPKKLNAAQKEQYHQLIRQKSNGFYMQASGYERQWASKWNDNAVASITSNFQNSSWEIQNVLKNEIQILSQNAPDSAKNRLLRALNDRRERPSTRELMTARQELQNDPFDTSKIQRLRELEKQAGRTTMVSYLDARLIQLKKGAAL